MTDNFFLDSNILLYAFMNDPQKQEIARRIMEVSSGVISNQVVAEVSSNLIKKAGYTNQEVSLLTEELYAYFQVSPVGRSEFIKSAEIREKYRLSFWDSLIIASAIEASCDLLYSEDMQSGMKIENLTILNPFK